MSDEARTRPWIARLRGWATARNLAGIAIVALLLGALRTLVEPYRLFAYDKAPEAATLEALRLGGLIFVACVLLTVLPYLFGRYRLALLAFAISIAAMIAFKQLYLPAL